MDLHSDDFYKDNNVLKIIAETFKKKDADLVYGDLVYVSKKHPFKVLRYWVPENILKNLSNGWMPPHPTVLLEKVFLTKLENIKQTIKFHQITISYLSFKKTILKIYIPKISNMRIGGTSNNSIKNLLKNLLKILR